MTDRKSLEHDVLLIGASVACLIGELQHRDVLPTNPADVDGTAIAFSMLSRAVKRIQEQVQDGDEETANAKRALDRIGF